MIKKTRLGWTKLLGVFGSRLPLVISMGMVFTFFFIVENKANTTDPSQTVLSNVAQFNRCYTHLTRLRVASDHPLLAEVKAGTLDPVAACMKVLESAQLVMDGSRQELVPNNPEALSVISTLNSFHRSWFPNDSFPASVPVGDCRNKTSKIYDESEAALHVTHALLSETGKYSDVVTGSYSYEAIRGLGQRTDSIKVFTTPKISNTGGRPLVSVNLPVVQQGELLGVRAIRAGTPKADLTVNGLVSPDPINVHNSEGGGILGTKSYLLLNLGRPGEGAMDGGLALPRRWSKAIFSDLLCREIPLIRTTDTIPYITRSPTDQTPPFRTNRNCMACHIPMDQAATVARNVAYDYTGSCSAPVNSFETIRTIAESKPREPGFVDSDSDFSKRPPIGKVFYRDYMGEMISKDIRGIPEFGAVLAEHEDLYLCAASRYFYYFTGLQVNFQDIGDPSNPPLTSAETQYRDRVITLGKNLKSHQSLKAMIQEIMASDIYKTTSMRTWGLVSNED